MLTHHDGRPYEEAASAAAKQARGLMEAKLEKGAEVTQNILNQIETNVPTDVVIKAKGLKFGHSEDGGTTVLGWKQDGEMVLRSIHQHALSQIREKLKGPDVSYLNYLASTGRAELAANILNAHLKKEGADKAFLTRALNGEVRGFMSDKFNPYDSPAIAHAFIENVQKSGCVLTDGIVSDIRHNL